MAASDIITDIFKGFGVEVTAGAKTTNKTLIVIAAAASLVILTFGIAWGMRPKRKKR